MSSTISFSKSDLLRTTVVDPAWYEIEVQTVGEWELASKGNSNNLEMDSIVIRNADSGDTKFAGVPVTLRFNDQPSARPFIEGFLRSIGVNVKAETYDLKNSVGRKLTVFVKNGTWQGRLKNEVEAYRDPRVGQQVGTPTATPPATTPVAQ